MIDQGFSTKTRTAGRTGLLTLLAAAPLLVGTLAMAQYGPPQGGYGPPPEGYGQYYHERDGHPMLGARQGWAAGMAQGINDRNSGHSNRPTHVDTFRHVPESPEGYPRDQFKNEYRDAFVKGYERGYNGGGPR